MNHLQQWSRDWRLVLSAPQWTIITIRDGASGRPIEKRACRCSGVSECRSYGAVALRASGMEVARERYLTIREETHWDRGESEWERGTVDLLIMESPRNSYCAATDAWYWKCAYCFKSCISIIDFAEDKIVSAILKVDDRSCQRMKMVENDWFHARTRSGIENVSRVKNSGHVTYCWQYDMHLEIFGGEKWRTNQILLRARKHYMTLEIGTKTHCIF